MPICRSSIRERTSKQGARSSSIGDPISTCHYPSGNNSESGAEVPMLRHVVWLWKKLGGARVEIMNRKRAGPWRDAHE